MSDPRRPLGFPQRGDGAVEQGGRFSRVWHHFLELLNRRVDYAVTVAEGLIGVVAATSARVTNTVQRLDSTDAELDSVRGTTAVSQTQFAALARQIADLVAQAAMLEAAVKQAEGQGPVRGPRSSTDNAVTRWDGTGGNLLQNSGVLIDDSNNVSGVGTFSGAGNVTINTNAWVVDAANKRAGAGIAAPVSPLHAYQDDTEVGAAAGVTVEQDGTGDALLQFLLTGAQRWVAGIDNSDDDAFKLGRGAGWTTGTDIRLSTAGEINLPSQPCFLAYNAATLSNVTGNGTTYAVVCGTELYDQGGNYNTGTGTFTAPVTGRYDLRFQCRVDDLASATIITTRIATTARTYSERNDGSFTGSRTGQVHAIADMTQGDTATFTVAVFGMAGDTADVNGGAASVLNTFVCGMLVA